MDELILDNLHSAIQSHIDATEDIKKGKTLSQINLLKMRIGGLQTALEEVEALKRTLKDTKEPLIGETQ